MSRQHLTAHLFILLLFSLAGRNSNFIKLNELNVEDREDRNLINTRSEEDAAATTFTWIFFCSINSIEGTKKKRCFVQWRSIHYHENSPANMNELLYMKFSSRRRLLVPGYSVLRCMAFIIFNYNKSHGMSKAPSIVRW